MKYIIFILMCLCLCTPAKSQTYDELIDKAMDAVEQDSLLLAENYFKEALRLEPANMRNSLLFSNLGTIQRRMGKRKEALESYSLALNKTPFSVTMLLNRASLLLEMNCAGITEMVPMLLFQIALLALYLALFMVVIILLI